MKLKKGTYIGLIATTLVVTAGFVGFNYNNNHLPEQKIVGSMMKDNRLDFDRVAIDSFDTLVDFSDLIVVGKVIDDGVTINNAIPQNPHFDSGSYETTNSTIEIDEVIYGNETNKTITYVQLGKAGDDHEQTKVKKGQKVLLVLKKTPYNNYTSSMEDGVFLVSGKNKVKSFSMNPVVSKFDDKDIDDLKKELKETKKLKNTK